MPGISNVAIGAPKVSTPPVESEKKEEKEVVKPVEPKTSKQMVTRAAAKSDKCKVGKSEVGKSEVGVSEVGKSEVGKSGGEKRKAEETNVGKSSGEGADKQDSNGPSTKKVKVDDKSPSIKSNASQKDKKEPVKRTAAARESKSQPAVKKSKSSGAKKSTLDSSSSSDSDYDAATKIYLNQQLKQAESAKAHYEKIKMSERRLAEAKKKVVDEKAKKKVVDEKAPKSLHQVIKENKDAIKEKKRRLDREKTLEKGSPKRERKSPIKESKPGPSQSRSSSQSRPPLQCSSKTGSSGNLIFKIICCLPLCLDYRPAYNYGNRGDKGRGDSRPSGSIPECPPPVKIKSRQRLSYEKVSKERTSTYNASNSSSEHES